MVDVIKDLLFAIYNNILTICILLLIVGIIYFILKIRKSVKLTHDTIIGFTGTLGAGKTFNGVRVAIKCYKNKLRAYKLKKFINPFKKHIKPTLFSNIPIKINKKTWSYKIIAGQLMFEYQFPQNAVVFCDELGDLAGQNDFDNAYVVDKITGLFIRFFRHTINGRFIFTDQSISSIYKGIRVRVGKVYNLSDFCIKYFFFFQTNCRVLEMSEDNIQNVNITNQEETPYLFGLKGKTFKQYDSRCYSILYDNVPKLPTYDQWTQFKTNEFIKIPYLKMTMRNKLNDYYLRDKEIIEKK